MKEIEYQIICELKQEQKKNKEILNELVIERTKITSNKKFNLEELKQWSQYFNMSMTSLLREILVVSNDDYQKLLKGHLKRVNSDNFNKAKEIMINRKHKKYYANRNLNRRNYYNRDKISKESQKLQINTTDYVLRILNKTRTSFIRVMKDVKSKKRLYIGNYVNTELPIEYISSNYSDMLTMFSIAVNKISRRFGQHITIQNREDIIQDCMCYMIENGNLLDKNNKPIIKENLASKKQKIRMYNQSYFYILNRLKTYNLTDSSYNDKMKYIDTESKFCNNDVEDYIENEFNDELTKNIFKMIYKEGNNKETKNKIMNKFNITSERIEEIIANYTNNIIS